MDYDYLSVSDGNGDAALMHVTAPGRLIGSTVNPVDSIVNVPAKFIATSGTLNASGVIDPTTKTDFKGHLESNTVVIDSFEPGSTDKGALEGDVIMIKPNTGWANRIATVIKNLTGFGTAPDITVGALAATGLTVTNNVTADRFTPTGAVLLDGRSNATYRYTVTSGDVTAGYIRKAFAHGLAYAPRVQGYMEFSVPANPATEMRFPLPYIVTGNINYFGKPVSAEIDYDVIDDTNIQIAYVWADATGTPTAGQVLCFEFYCTPRPT